MGASSSFDPFCVCGAKKDVPTKLITNIPTSMDDKDRENHEDVPTKLITNIPSLMDDKDREKYYLNKETTFNAEKDGRYFDPYMIIEHDLSRGIYDDQKNIVTIRGWYNGLGWVCPNPNDKKLVDSMTKSYDQGQFTKFYDFKIYSTVFTNPRNWRLN